MLTSFAQRTEHMVQLMYLMLKFEKNFTSLARCFKVRTCFQQVWNAATMDFH